MQDQISRFASMDDLWSVLGYVLILTVNQFVSNPMALPTISLLASGMLAILWIASRQIRQRNIGRAPNARVVFWAIIAVVSAVGSLR
jgi:hypothetical protein